MDRTITISDDITILSTDPNDLGTCATLYDALAERTAAAMAYDITKDGGSEVSDVDLLSMAPPKASTALMLGSDPNGTNYIVGMVRIICH